MLNWPPDDALDRRRTADDPAPPAPRPGWPPAGRSPRRRGLRRVATARRPAVSGVVACDRRRHGTVRRFHSAPELEPPTTYTLANDAAPADGHYLFMGPAGGGRRPVGTDDRRQRAASRSGFGSGPWPTNFAVHTYRGEPVLVWWEGRVLTGYGFGEAVILDRSYREIARVRAANGRHIDLHELTLTDRGTALFTCPPVTTPREPERHRRLGPRLGARVDLPGGRHRHRPAHPGVAQPRSRRPGGVLPRAHARVRLHAPQLDRRHPGRQPAHLRPPHLGAVQAPPRDRRGDVASGRKAEPVRHGPRLRSSPGSTTSACPTPGRITVFDNGDDGRTKTHPTRALELGVDERARRVTLSRAYLRPRPVDATAMGSARRLGDGHMAVGWGSAPYVTEFDAGGAVRVDLRIGTSTDQKSYRSFRQAWSGRPATDPRPRGLARPLERPRHRVRQLERRHRGRALASRGRPAAQ